MASGRRDEKNNHCASSTCLAGTKRSNTDFDVVFDTLSGLASAVSDGNSVRDRQRKRLAVLERENAGLRKQRDGKGTVRYKGKNVQVKEAVSDAASSLKRRVSIATARNIAATPGEALPIFGIAVIAAATAWEVKDACATLNELYELDVALNPENAIDTNEVCGKQVPTTEGLVSTIKESPVKIWESMQKTYGDLPEFAPSRWYARLIQWASSFLSPDNEGFGDASEKEAVVE